MHKKTSIQEAKAALPATASQDAMLRSVQGWGGEDLLSVGLDVCGLSD